MSTREEVETATRRAGWLVGGVSLMLAIWAGLTGWIWTTFYLVAFALGAFSATFKDDERADDDA